MVAIVSTGPTAGTPVPRNPFDQRTILLNTTRFRGRAATLATQVQRGFSGAPLKLRGAANPATGSRGVRVCGEAMTQCHRLQTRTPGQGWPGRGLELGEGPARDGLDEPAQRDAQAPNKKAQPRAGLICLQLVPRRGLEPPRFYPLVPETSASTNSATWAGAAALCAGSRKIAPEHRAVNVEL